MNKRRLDPAWKAWLTENLERQCEPKELVAILLKNKFSLRSIKESMGDRFPVEFELLGETSSEQKDVPRDPGVLLHGTGERRLDDSWKAWLTENLERGCDPEELLNTLLKNRFSLDSIRTFMAQKLAIDLESFGDSLPESESKYLAISQPRLIRSDAHPKLTRVQTDRLQLYTLDDFMTESECDAIVALINRHLRPSTITIESNDKYFRTSRTCDLSTLKSPIVAAIDEKIAKTLGIRLEYTEGNQAQRYDVGQEFKPHTDYFEPGTSEYIEHAAARGNRTWTFMVYLNEGMQGGGTKFFAIDKSFLPRKGQAVIWNNLYPDGTPNPDTLHSGEPVVAGHKIIITKWFREKGMGPMFYED